MRNYITSLQIMQLLHILSTKKTRLDYNKKLRNQNTKLWLQKQTWFMVLTEASTIRICLKEPCWASCLGKTMKYQSALGLTVGGVYCKKTINLWIRRQFGKIWMENFFFFLIMKCNECVSQVLLIKKQILKNLRRMKAYPELYNVLLSLYMMWL